MTRFGIVFVSLACGVLAAAGAWIARADEPVGSSVRYNREIVRIFDRKCIACHGAAGLAMSLDRYHDVRPWARAIREEILERRMPPWPAAPGVRPLANELALTTREIAIITSWIDGGTPRGDPWDLPPPAAKETWKAGEPDLTIRLTAQHVRLDGAPQVRRVTVKTDARERWLRGFDIVPGERRALRSAFVYAHTPAGAEWLGGWSPWYAMRQAPDGVGFRLPPGASLDVELHYAGWDEGEPAVTDTSRLGLYFHESRPPADAKTLTVAARGTARPRRGDALLSEDRVILAVQPRFDGNDPVEEGALEMRAVTPGGVIEPLVWIKDYRREWQLPYVLREPLHLPRGSRLVFTAHGAGGATAHALVLTYRPRGAAAPTAESPVTRPAPPPLRP